MVRYLFIVQRRLTHFAKVFCINGMIPALLSTLLLLPTSEEEYKNWTFGQTI
ncbi:hypothetical protein AVEN_201891-1, partial [Araneus ventricosus]